MRQWHYTSTSCQPCSWRQNFSSCQCSDASFCVPSLWYVTATSKWVGLVDGESLKGAHFITRRIILKASSVGKVSSSSEPVDHFVLKTQ
jgi:hypothetical protein